MHACPSKAIILKSAISRISEDVLVRCILYFTHLSLIVTYRHSLTCVTFLALTGLGPVHLDGDGDRLTICLHVTAHSHK